MPITNLNNSKHLSTAKLADAENALTTLEDALSEIKYNLTPEERQKYGSINEQNKLMVAKVNDFYINQPQLGAPEVDWDEFAKDFESRKNIENMINRLEAITQNLKNAKILHDFDNYQAALTDYSYSTYKAGSASAGYETKHTELKQFFSNRSNMNPQE